MDAREKTNGIERGQVWPQSPKTAPGANDSPSGGSPRLTPGAFFAFTRSTPPGGIVSISRNCSTFATGQKTSFAVHAESVAEQISSNAAVQLYAQSANLTTRKIISDRRDGAMAARRSHKPTTPVSIPGPAICPAVGPTGSFRQRQPASPRRSTAGIVSAGKFAACSPSRGSTRLTGLLPNGSPPRPLPVGPSFPRPDVPRTAGKRDHGHACSGTTRLVAAEDTRPAGRPALTQRAAGRVLHGYGLRRAAA